MDFSKGNIFRFHGFDSIDAIILFVLGAVLTAAHHLIQLDLGPKANGSIIALSMIGSLFLRQVYLPTEISQHVDPNRSSLIGMVAVFIAAAGFACSIFGFNNLFAWSSFQPEQISNREILAETKRRLESEEMQGMLAVMASAREVDASDEKELAKNTETLTFEEIKKQSQKDVEARRAEIVATVMQELQAENNTKNEEAKARYWYWVKNLIPMSLLLLLMAAHFEKSIRWMIQLVKS